MKAGLTARVKYLGQHFGPTWAQVPKRMCTRAVETPWIRLFLSMGEEIVCRHFHLRVQAMALGATPAHIRTTTIHLTEMADELLFRYTVNCRHFACKLILFRENIRFTPPACGP